MEFLHTRNKINLHKQGKARSITQTGVHYNGINKLPDNIKLLKGNKVNFLKKKLTNFLRSITFFNLRNLNYIKNIPSVCPKIVIQFIPYNKDINFRDY